MGRRQTSGRNAVLLLLLGIAVPVFATTAYQGTLPLLVGPNSCDTCHLEDATPSSSDSELNDFGLDFSMYLTWNSTLAALDSDGDGCTNGAEIGDVDGNGQPDEGTGDEASSNPGVAGDCSSASMLEEKSWGELKAMFNR